MNRIEEIAQVLLEHGYTMGSYIGAGSFGSCVIVNSLKYARRFVCKSIDISGDGRENRRTSFSREVESLVQLPNPHIIKIYDYFDNEKYLFMILELCLNGSMQDIIYKNKKLSYDNVRQMMNDVLSGLSFCHQTGFAHRDIKPSNILVDEFHRAKLGDFGLAEMMHDGTMSTEFVGSLPFMAPEIIKKVYYDPMKADIWAFGVTFYYLVMRTLPFPGPTKEEIGKQQYAGYSALSRDVPDDIRKVIQFCLSGRVSTRPSAEELKAMLNQASTVSRSSGPQVQFLAVHSNLKMVIEQTRRQSHGKIKLPSLKI